jgi:hypothetical protein
MSRFKSVDADDVTTPLRERIQRGAAHCTESDNYNVVVTHQSGLAIPLLRNAVI